MNDDDGNGECGAFVGLGALFLFSSFFLFVLSETAVLCVCVCIYVREDE